MTNNNDNKFTHVDSDNGPCMVDVSQKNDTTRMAHARTFITLTSEVLSFFNGKDIESKKGPVFTTAVIAGTMAAKKTSELIPFCHPLFLEDVKIAIHIVPENKVQIDCRVKTSGKTGVEMEALMGAQLAALTIYDMCKAFGHLMEISQCQLIEKSGGKNDFKRDQ